MAIRRDLVVPIPEVNHIVRERKKDGSVTVMYVLEAPYDPKRGYTLPKRVTIGHALPESETEMHPTDKYREVFPSLWATLTGTVEPCASVSVGLYVAIEAILEGTGLGTCLKEAFGYEVEDALRDLALATQRLSVGAALTLADALTGQLCLPGTPRDDASFAQVLTQGVDVGASVAFRDAWARRCASQGADAVWLCVNAAAPADTPTGVEGEPGTVLIRAVTEDGLLVGCFCHTGALSDTGPITAIADRLGAHGIRVSGILLEDVQDASGALEELDACKVCCLARLRRVPKKVQSSFDDLACLVKRDVSRLVGRTEVTAAASLVHLADDATRPTQLTLFFDHIKASQATSRLLQDLWQDADAVEERIASGETPLIPERSYGLLTTKDGELIIDWPALQRRIDAQGLYATVSSKELTAAHILALLGASDGTEPPRPLWPDWVEGTADGNCPNGLTVALVACAMVKRELIRAAKVAGLDLATLIDRLDQISATRVNGTYVARHTQDDLERRILEALGCTDGTLDRAVKAANARRRGHATERTRPKKATAKQDKAKAAPKERKKPGPKPGFKRGDTNADGSPRKKPGPKPGFKRGAYNQDGSLRKKPGPKPGSHNVRTQGRRDTP